MKLKNYIRLSEAARLVGVAHSTVHQAYTEGKLRVEKTGCGLPMTTEPWVKIWRDSIKEQVKCE